MTWMKAVLAGAPSDVLQGLRQSTRFQHEWLDQRLPLGRCGASISHYRDHLLATAVWLHALMPWLERSGDSAPAARRRLAAIALDLSDCPWEARGAPQVDGLGLREADDGSPAFGAGVAYVVEGSALGGQVLRRRLEGPLAPHPLRYLAGDERGVGERWREVLHGLRSGIRAPQEHKAACAGAVAAFEEFALLLPWLEARP